MAAETSETTATDQQMSGLQLRAVVIGGSGAIGKNLLGELLKSQSFSKVTSLGRRSIKIPETFSVDQDAEEASGRFEQKIVDFENLSVETVGEHFKDKDVFFSTLGTTRRDAGSAQAFRHVDFDYVTQCAAVAKQQGVKHASLISSKGANASSMFLYLKVKGEVEEEFKKLGFSNLSIYQPGFLDRGDKARFLEKVASWFSSPIGTDTVAKAMRVDAEKVAGAPAEGASTPVQVLLNADIHKLCSDQ